MNLPALSPLPRNTDWRFESMCARSNQLHFGALARYPWLHAPVGQVFSNPYFRPEALIAYRIWRMTFYMARYARMLP